MNIRELNLPDTKTNAAVAGIIAQLKRMVDRNGRDVFATTEAGVMGALRFWDAKSPTRGTVTPEQVPAAFVWQDSQQGESTSMQFYVGEVRSLISIYLVLYDFSDEANATDSFQAVRQQFVEFVVSRLQYPDSEVTDNDGLVPAYADSVLSWKIVGAQIVAIDHTTAFRRVFGEENVLMHPWYASRIDIQVQAEGLSDT